MKHISDIRIDDLSQELNKAANYSHGRIAAEDEFVQYHRERYAAIQELITALDSFQSSYQW